MDNASKALIIAGAVLIAVMLVSVGVLVYNNSIGVIKTGLDIVETQEAALFNATYKNHLGTNLGRTSAEQLVDNINILNSGSSDRSISLTGDAVSTTDGRYSLVTAKNARYDITCTTQDSSGFITGMSIGYYGGTGGE